MVAAPKPPREVTRPDGRVLTCTQCGSAPARFYVSDTRGDCDPEVVCSDTCFMEVVDNCYKNEYSPEAEGTYMRPVYEDEVEHLVATFDGPHHWGSPGDRP